MSEPMNAWVPPDRPATTDDGRAGPTAATTPGAPVPGPQAPGPPSPPPGAPLPGSAPEAAAPGSPAAMPPGTPGPVNGSAGAPGIRHAATALLRPLDVAEILDGAIAGIRRDPRVILGCSLLVTAVVQVTITAWEYLFLGAGRISLSGFLGVRAMTTQLAVASVNLLLTALAVLVLGGLFAPVMGRALVGRTTGPGLAWADVRPRAVRIVAAAAVPILISVGTMTVALAPAAALAALDAPIVVTFLVGLVGAGAGIACAGWLYVRFAFAAPVVALERAGLGAALRRSARLVRGRWWRTFGALLLALLLTFLIGTGMQLPFDLGSMIILSAGPPDGGGLHLIAAVVVETAGRVVSGTLTNPFNAGVAVLLYADHRIRREGFDLELRTRSGTADDAGDLPPDALAALWRPSDLTAARHPAGHPMAPPATAAAYAEGATISPRTTAPWQDEPS